jgi:glucose/arabinose dehydrogenase
MRKAVIFASVLILAFITGRLIVKYYPGIKPAIQAPPEDISEIVKTDNPGPLKLPPGFEIEIFAKGLPGARVMAFDSTGGLWVSQTREGLISLVTNNEAGQIEARPVFTGLKNPHGLAFDPLDPFLLYIAEEDKISTVRIYSEGGLTKLIDLPTGGRHTTRTISFGPDDRLYISIGSSCDVCFETDPRRAAIYSMKKDGSDFRAFATGLRNAVFFTWQPDDQINRPLWANTSRSGLRPVIYLWTTEMGRDNLGDNLPPDEINVAPLNLGSGLEKIENFSPDYGWPLCYGQNIHDSNFDKNIYIRNPCEDKSPSTIDLPAHSAPLGLAFVPENSNWPKEYQGSLLVAYHGSWNRSVPTGYKITRFPKELVNYRFQKSTNPAYDIDKDFSLPPDFVTGWLTKNNEALGRPVDLKFKRLGGPYIEGETGKIIQAPIEDELYISDDKAGVIYRVRYRKP